MEDKTELVKKIAFFALIFALLSIGIAENIAPTNTTTGVQYILNTTNLAPHVAGEEPGTGERIADNRTYWANNSPLYVSLFSHANTSGKNSEIHLYINGTKYQDNSERPIGIAQDTNASLFHIIPQHSNYSVLVFNSHHYEWRETKVLTGNVTTVISSSDHQKLTNLNWSVARHIIDTSLNMNNNDLINVKNISASENINFTSPTGEDYIYSQNGKSFIRYANNMVRIVFNKDIAFSDTYEDNSTTIEISEDYAEMSTQRITNGFLNYSNIQCSLLPSAGEQLPVCSINVRKETSLGVHLTTIDVQTTGITEKFSNGSVTTYTKDSSGIDLDNKNLTNCANCPQKITNMSIYSTLYPTPTSNRSINTVYQNTLSVPSHVTITCYSTLSSNCFVNMSNSNPPMNQYVFTSLDGTHAYNLEFIVMPGWYYKIWVNSGTGSILTWLEWN